MELWQLKIIIHPSKQIYSVSENTLRNGNDRNVISWASNGELNLGNKFNSIVKRDIIKLKR